jgi:hypothetical protein
MIKKRIFLIIFILIVLTETVLHLFYSDEFDIAYRPVVYRSLPEVNYGYVPDTCFRLFGKTHRINSHGFLGEDFGEKTADTFRIAVIGSSTVAGSINLNAYYSFCSLLQKKFDEANIKVQILNCGVDGGGRSLELFRSIRHQVAAFSPDIILLEYFLPFETWGLIRENYNGYIVGYPSHDMKGKEDVKKMIDNLNTYRSVIDLLYHSFIVRSIIRFHFKIPKLRTRLSWYIELYEKKIQVLGDFIRTEYTIEESVDMIQDVKDELEKSDIRFFLFQYGKDDAVIRTTKSYKLQLISLGVSFSEKDYFHKDEHWNELGCQKIADRLYEMLLKYQLIPKRYMKE